MDNVVSWVVLAVLVVAVIFYIVNRLDVKETKRETKCNTYHNVNWK